MWRLTLIFPDELEFEKKKNVFLIIIIHCYDCDWMLSEPIRIGTIIHL
jgi:hypothetical protein